MSDMHKKQSYKKNALLLTISSGILFNFDSLYAQQVCSHIFESHRPKNISYESLHTLDSVTKNILTALSTKTEHIEPARLIAQIYEAELLNEAYLTSAGISYTRRVETINIASANMRNKILPITYYSYELSGSKQGNEVSRLLYGIQENPRFNNNPVQIVLDPLYKARYAGSGQIMRGKAIILVGPHLFTQSLLHISTTLRHEIQHFIEDTKVSKGELSLARIKMRNPKPQQKGSYYEMLFLDEIETHLRDIRTLSNTQSLKNWSTEMHAAQLAEAIIASANKYRDQVIKQKIHNLGHFFSSSREVIYKLRQALSDQARWRSIEIKRTPHGIILIFQEVTDSYPTVSLNLQGSLKPEESMNRTNIINEALKILEWSEDRIAAVEKEVNTISNNSNLNIN